MSLQAIVFDMDGLMVDSEPLAQRAWEQVVASYGQILDPATYTQMVGLRLQDSSRLVQEQLNLPATPAQLAAQKEAVLAEIRAEGLPTMPGLYTLQEEIVRRQIPWAVATSSRRETAELVLQQLGLLDRCHTYVGGDEVVRGKPAPDIYLLAAERLGMPPQACLALEDSLPGGQAATAAGMRLVAVPNGHASAADFDFAYAVYDSLTAVSADLPALLDYN